MDDVASWRSRLISVTMIDVDTYRVDIEGSMNATVEVRMTKESYLMLSGGRFTHEWTIVQVCRELISTDTFDWSQLKFSIDSLLQSHPDVIHNAKERLLG